MASSATVSRLKAAVLLFIFATSNVVRAEPTTEQILVVGKTKSNSFIRIVNLDAEKMSFELCSQTPKDPAECQVLGSPEGYTQVQLEGRLRELQSAELRNNLIMIGSAIVGGVLGLRYSAYRFGVPNTSSVAGIVLLLPLAGVSTIMGGSAGVGLAWLGIQALDSQVDPLALELFERFGQQDSKILVVESLKQAVSALNATLAGMP